MIVWHGSKYKFDKFLSPEESGNIRPSEEGRRVNRDVVFLTTNPAIAMQYAGNGGLVYEVETSENNLTPLKQSRILSGVCRKPKNCAANIYVARPTALNIVATWQVVKYHRHNTGLVES